MVTKSVKKTETAKCYCDDSMEYIKSGRGLPPLNSYSNGLLVETSGKKNLRRTYREYGTKIDQVFIDDVLGWKNENKFRRRN